MSHRHQVLADELSALADAARDLELHHAWTVLRLSALLAHHKDDRTLLRVAALFGAAALGQVPRPAVLEEASRAILRQLSASPAAQAKSLTNDELLLALGHEHARALRLETELASLRIRYQHLSTQHANKAWMEGPAPGESGDRERGRSGGP
jgi:hypothetical protein